MKARRIPRPARCPTLVALHLAPEVGVEERLAAESFAGGWTTDRQFNVLADCRDLLALSAAERHDVQAAAICDIAAFALLNIKDRYLALKRFGASGDEIQALRALVDFSEDYWKRQSGEAFRRANVALDRARRKQIQEAIQ